MRERTIQLQPNDVGGEEVAVDAAFADLARIKLLVRPLHA